LRVVGARGVSGRSDFVGRGARTQAYAVVDGAAVCGYFSVAHQTVAAASAGAVERTLAAQ
jgi:hypothetical protein